MAWPLANVCKDGATKYSAIRYSPASGMRLRALALTAAALVGFAANSLLCRRALGEAAIDAYSFTGIRIASGALILALITRPWARQAAVRTSHGSWRDALWLTAYALPFSIAYRWLDTGTGALLLFGAVQLTLIAWAIRAGERPSLGEWLGLLGAGAGLIYLVLPGLTAPEPLGAAFMILAGVSWGLYTVAGKRGGNPMLRTGGNFARATLLMLPIGLLAIGALSVTPAGVALAVASGALASGLGYAAWYAALHYHTATRAALLQLIVPVLAAAGGIAVLGEPLTLRLVVASALVLGSLAFATRSRSRKLA
jgi:drug/metabolite transporter (DMT)-like permease